MRGLSPVFIVLLIANVVAVISALVGLYCKGTCFRLVMLRVYLCYIILGPGVVGMYYLMSWNHITRQQYLTGSWTLCLLDNGLLLLLAVDLTSWLIPKQGFFVFLWAGVILTVVTVLHFAKLESPGVPEYWFLSRTVNLSVLGVMIPLLSGKFLVPEHLWRDDYLRVAKGICILATGNMLLNSIPTGWMERWPMTYGMAVPTMALISNVVFSMAAWRGVGAAQVTQSPQSPPQANV